MNYPVWYLPDIGGGLLIALIAILHVFVSHFAVGGGLYLIYAEKKAVKENNQKIMAFTRSHARFFLLLTMVFGSITGVGIWFIIALVNPAATSMLIHTFVFGWAAEWVFFVVEIVAAFVYYYMFGRMDSSTHLKIGWVYFISAWMSLFLINGIICFMLTPGGWLETGNFWIGFFNPNFLPSLFFRTFIAVLMAGVFGCLTSSFTADEMTRVSMTRFSGKWSLAALVGVIPSAIWYVSVLPGEAKGLVLGKSPTISSAVQWGSGAVLLLLAIILVANIVKPALNKKVTAVIAMVSALIFFGSFEWIREAARRPFAINEVVYSNMLMKDTISDISEKGFLPSATFVKTKEINDENMMKAGEEIFIHQCYACHTINGFNNDIVSRTASMSFGALQSYIKKIHKLRYFMPPFAGTDEEAQALAAYIAGGLHNKEVVLAAEAAGSDGVAVFENNCSACHAAEDLAPYFEGAAPEEIMEALASLDQISEEMVPFEGSKEETAALTSYLFSLNNEGTPTSGQPGAGSVVFENNCSACHAAEDLAPYFEGAAPEEIMEALASLDQISEEMVPFEGSKEETAALTNYLFSLNNEEDSASGQQIEGPVLFENNCSACHGVEEMADLIGERDQEEIRDALDKLETLSDEMVPYEGSPEEKDVLADYLNSLKGE